MQIPRYILTAYYGISIICYCPVRFAGNGLLSYLSRKLRMGLTIFWGPFGLPIPYTPRVTLCVGDPIPVKKWVPTEDQKTIPNELLEELQRF